MFLIFMADYSCTQRTQCTYHVYNKLINKLVLSRGSIQQTLHIIRVTQLPLPGTKDNR